MSKVKKAFDFYKKFADHCGTAPGDFMSGQIHLLPVGGKNALDCFIEEENGIEVTECKEPELLRQALLGKKLVNFHMTDLWTTHIKEMYDWSPYIAWQELFSLMDAFEYFPEWVWKTIWQKVIKEKEDGWLFPWDKVKEKRKSFCWDLGSMKRQKLQ